MNKLTFMAAILLMLAAPGMAQDWVKTADGAAAYDCAVITAMSLEFRTHTIVRLDTDLYSLSDFFGILVPDCKPALDSPSTISSPEHEADRKKSAINETEYDCAKLAEIIVDHGDQVLVIGATDVRYTVSEVFASLAPDCVPSVETRDLLTRIGSDAGWVEGTHADFEYYCDFISVALAEYGELDFIRLEGKVLAFNDYNLQAVPLCNLRADLPRKAMLAPCTMSGYDTGPRLMRLTARLSDCCLVSMVSRIIYVAAALFGQV